MSVTNPMDKLAQLLADFHISERLADDAAGIKRSSTTVISDPKTKGISDRHSSSPIDAQCKPFWQPPILNYSEYVLYLEAEKEILTSRRSRLELSWRVAVMDGLLEDKLLDQYKRHIGEERSSAACEEEKGFLSGLPYELGKEFEENKAELEEDVKMRHGKKNKEFY